MRFTPFLAPQLFVLLPDSWCAAPLVPVPIPEKDDRYELGRDLPKIAEIAFAAKTDGKCILAEVKNGDGGEVAYYLVEGRRSICRRSNQPGRSTPPLAR